MWPEIPVCASSLSFFVLVWMSTDLEYESLLCSFRYFTIGKLWLIWIFQEMLGSTSHYLFYNFQCPESQQVAVWQCLLLCNIWWMLEVISGQCLVVVWDQLDTWSPCHTATTGHVTRLLMWDNIRSWAGVIPWELRILTNCNSATVQCNWDVLHILLHFNLSFKN